MVNTNLLKARIVEKGFRQYEVAQALGLSSKVWYDRIKSKRFDSDEIYLLINILEIADPMPIFFVPEVTH